MTLVGPSVPQAVVVVCGVCLAGWVCENTLLLACFGGSVVVDDLNDG